MAHEFRCPVQIRSLYMQISASSCNRNFGLWLLEDVDVAYGAVLLLVVGSTVSSTPSEQMRVYSDFQIYMAPYIHARDPHISNEGTCTSAIARLADTGVDVAGTVEDAVLEPLAELELELLASVEYLVRKSASGSTRKTGCCSMGLTQN